MTRHLMAAALCAGFAAPPAAAQMYLGLGAGAARTDTHQTSYKLYGGYQFSPNWGLELGYNDLGRYLGARSESWTLAGTGTLPVTNNWSLLGKLGVAANRTARSIRSLSSRIRSWGSPMARMTPAPRSCSPPT